MSNRIEPIVTNCQALKSGFDIVMLEPMVQIDEEKEKIAFAERLNAVLDAADVPTKIGQRSETLAKEFQMTAKGVEKWLKGLSIPPQAKINHIVRKYSYTGVTVEWLLGGKESLSPFRKKNEEGRSIYDTNTSQAYRAKGWIPLISRIKAGEWCESLDCYEPGDAEKWMPGPEKHGKHTYALKVEGDSMTSPYAGQKSYPEGVIIYVDPEIAIHSGCRVVAKLPDSDQATFKEYREENGKRYLKPLNPQYPMMEITDDTRICGVVIGYYVPE